MTMPKAIRDVLLPFYNATKHQMTPHEPVPGGYLNVDKIEMNRLNLDNYPDIRIYRRGAMLINHVDRGDSHLASAVMQVAQDVDEDGGWPLEVLLGNKEVGEVYLQPG